MSFSEKSIDVVAVAMVSGEDDDASSNASLISTDVASVSQNSTSDDTVMSEVVTMKMNIGNHDSWPEDIGVHKMSDSEIIGVQGDSLPVKSKRKRKRPASEIYECKKLQSKISLEKHQITHSGIITVPIAMGDSYITIMITPMHFKAKLTLVLYF